MAAPAGLLAGRKHARAHLGNVLVVGLGRSGRAAVSHLLRERAQGRVSLLLVADGDTSASARAALDELAQQGAAVACGEDAVERLAARVSADGARPRFDLCVMSPGVAPDNPLFRAAARMSAEVVSEVELAWRESRTDARWVVVTGTNGKTTTTALLAGILRGAGMKAAALGNIGSACLEAVSTDSCDVFVCEASSFQLASTSLLAPDVSCVLNITPDHLSWHKAFEAYRAAKLKCLDNLGKSSGVAVLGAADEEVRQVVRALRARGDKRAFPYVPVGTAQGIHGDMRAACGSDNAAFARADGTLVVAFDGVEHVVGHVCDLAIRGEHNVMNALAAASCAVALGARDASIARALAAFAPLAHRIEPCGSIDGVVCYNDSKATNVDATLKALAAFPGERPFVLLGGYDKHTDLRVLVSAVHENARGAVCFGAAGARFEQAFEEAGGSAPAGFALARAERLEDALDAALAFSRPGDVVLLSPACASFDEFDSYGARGDAFKRLVAIRAQGVEQATGKLCAQVGAEGPVL